MPGLGLKRSAIEVLGEYRAVEAVPVLFEHLQYKAVVGYGSPDDAASLSKNYPAVGSLIKIGSPSAEKALNRIAVSDDELDRKLCSWMLREIHGEKIGADILRGRAESTQDQIKRKRYSAAVKCFELKDWYAKPH